MKIQLITQNIKPMGLKTETNSNPILKSTHADSFERQNVAFKGSNVPKAFKEQVLASIATKGEKGLDALCPDMQTFRQTLTFLRDFLSENADRFWKIAYKEESFADETSAIDALVQHHNEFANGVAFWEKLHQDNSKSRHFIEEMRLTTEDHNDFILPLQELTGGLSTRGIIIPKDQLDFPDGLSLNQKVRKWVTWFFK